MTESKRIVLVADDDLDLLEQMKMELERMDFQVETVESQADGEHWLELHKPDLAIFDLMMEHQDSGFVLSYKVKKKYPEVPVIIVTNVTNETGMRFDASSSEMRSWIKADAVLDKNVRYEQLKGEIDRLLGA